MCQVFACIHPRSTFHNQLLSHEILCRPYPPADIQQFYKQAVNLSPDGTERGKNLELKFGEMMEGGIMLRTKCGSRCHRKVFSVGKDVFSYF